MLKIKLFTIFFLCISFTSVLAFDDIFIPLPQDNFMGTVIVSVPIGESIKKPSNYRIMEDINLSAEEIISWNIRKINAEEFWGLSKGEGVKIGILDTGIDYNHPDLGGCFGEGCKVAGGYDFFYEDDDPMDDDIVDGGGHGTSVAGIIAAEDNEIGLVGVAPEAELYAVKVMNKTGGWLSDILQGLDWCLDNDMDIVVMSFGSNDYNEAFREKVVELYSHDIIIIAAAGNDGDLDEDNDIDYPARHESVIAVGATDIEDVHVSYSSDGPELELSAPGYEVLSTSLNDAYAYCSGTSFATPHVAGAAALLLSYGQYSPEDVRGILRENSVDLGDEGKDNYYGYGRIDLGSVFQLLNNQTEVNYSQQIQELRERVDELEGRLSLLEQWKNTIDSIIETIQTTLVNIWDMLTDHEARISYLETTTTSTTITTSTSSTTIISTTTSTIIPTTTTLGQTILAEKCSSSISVDCPAESSSCEIHRLSGFGTCNIDRDILEKICSPGNQCSTWSGYAYYRIIG